MKSICPLLAGSIAMLAVPAMAQVVAPAPAAPIVAGAQDTMLRTGTKVPMKLAEELTTKNKQLRVGQHFNMETVEPLMINGQVVVPAGTPAVGEITEVRNKGMWGKSGHFAAQMLYLTVGGRQVKLTGTFDDKGHAGGGAAVATSALVFLPAGFFMTGTSAKMPLGAPVTGFIGEDIPVAMGAAPVTPLQAQPVVASAPTTAPAAEPRMIQAVATAPVKK